MRMGNHLAKKMYNEMETGILQRFIVVFARERALLATMCLGESDILCNSGQQQEE